MDKSRLRDAILQKITAELDVITRAALMARDEATHEESKPENQYDMHAQEAAYLAEGQARLAAELQENLALYQNLSLQPAAPDMPISIGAIVTLEARGKKARYFLGPRSGGLDLEVDGRTITVVTPASPLGRQLLGTRVGSTVQLPGRGGQVAHQVVSIE